MTTSLFRPEAIDAHRAKIWGEVTLSLPLSLTAMTLFLVVCTASIAIFLTTATYARKVHAPGFLATRLGVANIIASRPGIITDLHVKEGQFVAAGTPLITISLEQTSEAGNGNRSAMLAGLRQQRANLDQQLDLETQATKAEAARLTNQIGDLQSVIEDMKQELDIHSARTAVAAGQVNSIADLVKRGVISQAEMKKRQDNHLGLQQAEMSFRLGISAKQAELRARQDELAQLPINSERKMSQLRVSVGDVEIKLRQTDGERAYLITAPKAGRVSALQAWAGKPVDITAPQMSIVPEGDSLDAELFVPTHAIGFVSEGQAVHISYASFPYQQFGFADGTVETISHTLLKPDQSAGPIKFDGSAYLIHVALKKQTISAYAKEIPLQADMQLTADVVINRRGLLAWLFDPLLAHWRRLAS
jgi:membrane fusion protein